MAAVAPPRPSSGAPGAGGVALPPPPAPFPGWSREGRRGGGFAAAARAKPAAAQPTLPLAGHIGEALKERNLLLPRPNISKSRMCAGFSDEASRDEYGGAAIEQSACEAPTTSVPPASAPCCRACSDIDGGVAAEVGTDAGSPSSACCDAAAGDKVENSPSKAATAACDSCGDRTPPGSPASSLWGGDATPTTSLEDYERDAQADFRDPEDNVESGMRDAMDMPCLPGGPELVATSKAEVALGRAAGGPSTSHK
mmetsp:Transcript_36854/g.106305  ORF Transcript_36854/g.106305 Transcript_36854/m.106305 type:complete len:254 (+) Transcript_36854:88-849(+)